MKKRNLLTGLLLMLGMSSFSQEIFKARLHESEHDVYMTINLYEETVNVPGMDIFGSTYGYIKRNYDTNIVWIITGVEISEDKKQATLEITNDQGSEDLTAVLTCNEDGTYLLEQVEGSTMKVAIKGKWVKLPKKISFKKK